MFLQHLIKPALIEPPRIIVGWWLRFYLGDGRQELRPVLLSRTGIWFHTTLLHDVEIDLFLILTVGIEFLLLDKVHIEKGGLLALQNDAISVEISHVGIGGTIHASATTGQVSHYRNSLLCLPSPRLQSLHMASWIDDPDAGTDYPSTTTTDLP